MPHLGKRIGTKAGNTKRRILKARPSERPGIAEARALLQANPNVRPADLTDRLVAQRQDAGKSFRGVPASALRKLGVRF